MEAYALDFANLLLRWLHVIAGIAWIGESIYFVMLDNSLKPPQDVAAKARGVFGDLWSVHGGGFYHSEKYLTKPPQLSPDLHWSFVKSYTTWLSGFALFALLYLANPQVYLVDHNSPWPWAATLSAAAADAVALAFMGGGWLVYDQLCRRISPNMERDGVLAGAVAVMMVGIAFLASHIFQGRAAFLLTGAVMATAMSANVFFWIIPGQRRMVAALKDGRDPNPLDGKRGKQRSVHNTYFTLPVVLLMISNHYSFTYSHQASWIIMSLLILAGALIRQYFVLRHSGRNLLALPILAAVLIAMVAAIAAPQGSGATAAKGVTTSTVAAILATRCTACHAQAPTQPGFDAAPAGVLLDNPRDILDRAAKIKEVVASEYMPLGNLTGMTAEERHTIASWEIP